MLKNTQIVRKLYANGIDSLLVVFFLVISKRQFQYNRFIMKSVIFSLMFAVGCILTSVECYAINDSIQGQQTVSGSVLNKLTKENIKKIKAVNDSIAHAEALTAIKDGTFIMIVDKTMDTSFIRADRRYNFFLVENNKILVQNGYNDRNDGNNKHGGYTIPSDIVSEISITEEDGKDVKCEFRLLGEYLSGDVKIKLDKKSSFAEINILQNGNSGDERVAMLRSGNKTVLFGNIIPFDASLIGDVIEIGREYVPEGWDPFTLGKKRDVGSLMDYLQGTRAPGDEVYTPENEE